MAEKKNKQTDETPVEETTAEATETEAAAPSVDEGEPMASTEAMDDAAAEADPGTAEEEAAPQPVPADEQPAEDDVAPAVEQAEETAPVAEEPLTEAEEPVAQEPAAEAEEAPAEEPAADEAPAEEPAAEKAAAPAPQSGPKPKRKRLPRALRPTKGRVTREKPSERKPITRIPKPEGEFGRRQERQGTVVSDKGDKTIVVKVDTIKAHPRYKKVVRRSKRFHAHDEQNAAKIGDVVKIIETRPISKTKNWRLAEILEVAK
jgi:small subunit ribosomal protein S17